MPRQRDEHILQRRLHLLHLRLHAPRFPLTEVWRGGGYNESQIANMRSAAGPGRPAEGLDANDARAAPRVSGRLCGRLRVPEGGGGAEADNDGSGRAFPYGGTRD